MSVPDPQTEVRRLYALTVRLYAENADLRRDRNMPSSAPSSPVGGTKLIPDTRGHPDPAQAPQERRARYEDALDISGFPGRRSVLGNVLAVADAELANAHAAWKSDRAEIERLKAEVYRLTVEVQDVNTRQEMLREVDAKSVRRSHECTDAAEAEVKRLRAEATWERLAAETGAEKAAAEYEHQAELLENIAGTDIDRLTAQRDEARSNFVWAQGERDAACAAIARVKALAEQWDQVGPLYMSIPGAYVLSRLRAALDAPTRNAEFPDGSGLWLSTPCTDACQEGPAAHDPPHEHAVYEADEYGGLPVGDLTCITCGAVRRAPNPHAAAKARIADAARRMGRPT